MAKKAETILNGDRRWLRSIKVKAEEKFFKFQGKKKSGLKALSYQIKEENFDKEIPKCQIGKQEKWMNHRWHIFPHRD